MKTKYIFILLLLYLVGSNLFAHDQIVHQAITTKAAASAYANSPAFANFISVISSDRSWDQETNSMVNGSWDEDWADQPGDVGGKRSYNHFYDPLTGLGMSDFPPDLRVMMGTNSFTWASVSNCPGFYFHPLFLRSQIQNINTSNIWSWQNARGYEWLGLTATNLSDRQTNLDNMFRAVGQVMHLLEDTSQPQHVRNEQHLDKLIPVIGTPWKSPIEDWGQTNVANLNYGDGSKLDWRGDGFTKLEDFWNRHLYAPGSATVLNAAENGGAQLGLAEWCNGNFIGDRHRYAESFYLQTQIKNL